MYTGNAEELKLFSPSELKKQIPNMITLCRIIGTVILLFMKPFTLGFYIIYSLCGLTDVLDGTVARMMKLQSEFGAKLDSIADLLYYAVLIIRIMPVLLADMQPANWVFAFVVLFIRIAAYIVAAVKYHCFASLHTYANKLTGFLMFALPYLMLFLDIPTASSIICLIAGFASVEELIIHLTHSKYTANTKSLLNKQTDFS